MNDGTNQRSERTRQALLDAAWQIVREHGLPALTMRRLASEARVSVGTAYFHFVDQAALIEDLRIRAWNELEHAIEAEVEPQIAHVAELSCERALRMILDSVQRFAAREPRLQELILLGPGANFTQRVMERDLVAATRFVALFYRGIGTGEFRANCDPQIVALALWTSVQGQLQRMAATMPDAFRVLQARAYDEILDAFFAHIRSRGNEVA